MKKKTVVCLRKRVFSWNEMDEMYRVFARYFSFLAVFGVFSCQPEWEKISSDPSVRLQFSSDTLYFDTLFVGLESPTLRLKVVNPIAQSVVISSVFLDEQSPYHLIVNGVQAQSHTGIRLLGKDSLLVLVKLIAQGQDTVFRLLDKLRFVTNSNEQIVVLDGYGRNANFFRDSILCNQTWRAGLPYVIREDVLVDSLCTLRIEQGCQIYLGTGSDIFVKGTLLVEGTPKNPVIFSQIRQDPAYQNLPGQWKGITFLVGSKNNLIEWAIIKNAVNGFYLGTPDQDAQEDLIVRYTIIYNMSRNGFQAYNSDLRLENCLIHNCIEGNVLILIGGNYHLRQNTFANFGFNFFRDAPSFIISNYLPGGSLSAPLNIELQNNIIWGSQKEELLLLSQSGVDFQIAAQDNLLRTERSDWKVNGNIVNENPRFLNPRLFDYRLDTLSPAIDKGQAIPDLPIDLKAKPRGEKYDLGAYERQ